MVGIRDFVSIALLMVTLPAVRAYIGPMCKQRLNGCRRMRWTASASNSALWETLGKPRAVGAPMVQQSELAFRLLARKYGVQLCFTPMLHAKSFLASDTYRREYFDLDVALEDRPLIAQFAGDDVEKLVRCIDYVADRVDAVDLNLGCPQRIAKKGHYGAYLLEDGDKPVRIVEGLSRRVSVPVTVKMRVLEDEQRTLRLAKAFQDAGAQILTVHGRTKDQNKLTVGTTNWELIGRIKQTLHIPVIANGGIETAEDVERCLSVTGADAVMSSEGLLEDPGLFLGVNRPAADTPFLLARRQLQYAHEYMDLAKAYPPTEGLASIKGHLFKFLHVMLELPVHHDIRNALAERLLTNDDCDRTIQELDERYADEAKAARFTHGEIVSPRSWYRRHRREDPEEGEADNLNIERGGQCRVEGSGEGGIDVGLAARLAAFKQAKKAAATVGV